MTYENAMALLRRYNRETFHIIHAITVSKVMRRMAIDLGYSEEADFWAVVGLLHDIDFEQWPDAHCKKCVELLEEAGCDERLIHAVVCHGYGLCPEVAPEHEMEKVLFACDELTGLIGACAKMRPSGSITDMDLKSLKKKYKSKGFAAGCSREVIAQGAELLGWALDTLLSRTLEAMKPDEAAIQQEVAALGL
ncbi:MAG: HD domain-containing protein [Clostridia bacterium]|nr:HD domain-containing protein [Clostridia bacterium]